MANKLLGLSPVNPLKVDVTSAAVVELVKLGLGIILEAEVDEGLIKAAIENKEGLFLVEESGNSVTSGVALQSHF